MFVPERSIMPLGGPEAYKTFQFAAPIGTHFRKAGCREVRCEAYENGWRSRVEAMAPNVLYAVTHSGRKYRTDHVAKGETWLVFEAGQPCFRASTHRIRIERDFTYLVRDGDWRGNPYGTDPYRHTKPELWVEQFAEHQQKIADRVERG